MQLKANILFCVYEHHKFTMQSVGFKLIISLNIDTVLLATVAHAVFP